MILAEPNTKKQSYLTGAAILAATVAITKIIGMIFKVPIYNLLGDEGTTHFQMAYNVYNLILAISTAGVPVALSRLIASARAAGKPAQAKRYYSVGMVLFGIVGIVGSVLMYFFSQELANLIGDSEISLAVKVLSPAVFFAAVVSVLRGYSQGHNDMVPTSLSQIMEVVCKLVFGLAIAWYLSSQGADLPTIAAGAIVGVTVGMGLAIPVMAIYKRRIAKKNSPLTEMDNPKTIGGTAREIIRVGLPITLGASAMTLITLIDSSLVLGTLQDRAGFTYDEAKTLFGVYSKALTLFNLPSAFITPVSVSVVPVIAAALAAKRTSEAKATIESSIKLTNLFALPAAVGLCVLSEPIFKLLYPNSNENGPVLLAILGIASYFVCIYLITNGVLQASGHELISSTSLIAGGVVKIVANRVLVGIPELNILGAPLGTFLCYIVITLVNLIVMQVKLPEKPNLFKITFRPFICTAVMGVGAYAVYGLLSKFALPRLGGGRLGLILCLGVTIVIAVVVYVVMVLAFKVITKEDVQLLPKGEKIAKILRLK